MISRPSAPWRLRPREGAPRCAIEQIAQYVYRHRMLLHVTLFGFLSLLLTVLR